MQNIHGVSVAEVPVVSAPPIPLPNISAGGLIGTAPDIVLETPNIAGGALTSIRVTNQGTGYTTAPAVTLTGGGSGANFTAADVDAIVVAGKVTEIVINNGGQWLHLRTHYNHRSTYKRRHNSNSRRDHPWQVHQSRQRKERCRLR